MDLSSSGPRFNYLATKEISQIVNVENAKRLSLVLMLCFSIYHGVLLLQSGGNTCKWLLSEGRFQGYRTWQPAGCMAHRYSRQDLRMCINYIAYWGGRSSIHFIGDSRMRSLYASFVSRLTGWSLAKSMESQAFHSASNNLQVVYKPIVAIDAQFTSYVRQLATSDTPPQLVIIAHPLLHSSAAVNHSALAGAVHEFNLNLTSARRHLQRLASRSKLLWMLQDPVLEYFINRTLSNATNSAIDLFNSAAAGALEAWKLQVWSSNRIIADSVGYFNGTDGIALSAQALSWDVQILANYYCNNHMKYSDGTCCSLPEPVAFYQVLALVFFACWIATAIALFLFNAFVRKAQVSKRLKSYTMTHHRMGSDAGTNPYAMLDCVYEIACALAKLGLILGYFFVCDRTIFFMKENKTFTVMNFVIPLLYVLVLGLFFTENSQNTQLLHRDITDEWKGVTQLVILIYHMTSASQVLPIYMHIRVCVSSYLFLSGYGHFTYFWTKGFRDCLVRGLRVLFRMNLFVICLCFVMNRPYQFYYFVPLVTFWYAITLCLMCAWPRASQSLLNQRPALAAGSMLLKICSGIALISLLQASDWLFDAMFLSSPARTLFVASEDRAHEWHFRWSLDRYSSLLGIATAFCVQVMRHWRVLVDNHQDKLCSGAAACALSAAGFIACLAYTIFAVLCPNKHECNSLHPYLVAMPLLGYAFLRNVWGSLRQRYSLFFAWFGRIALELYIAQYHVWLSNDTSGLLVLIPSNYVLNLIITSFIFVCLAHEVHSIARLLTPYAVPDDWRLALRNLTVFLVALLPIAVSHGAFG